MKQVLKYLKWLSIGIFLALVIMLCIFYKKDIPVFELKAKYAYNDSKFMDIDGQSVHYRIVGNGKPLVLLHGTGASLHTWEQWTHLLKDTFQMIMVDLPAFGLTGAREDRNYSIDMYVDFVNKFTEKLQLRQFDLAGNSLGGQIAWEFTTRFPQKVHKLALLDAVGYPFNKPVAQIFRLAQNPIMAVVMKKITPRFFIAKNIKEVYENDNLITDATIDRYYAMSLREGSRQAFVDRSNQKQFDNSAAIKTIENPVLILWGENDKWVSPDFAYRFHDDLKNDTLVFIKQCGHIPMEEKPEESAAIARAFFLK